MSRELKFRAWSGKVMRYSVAVTEDGRAIRHGYQWFNTDNDVYNGDVMQYTGMKDKNGKEIYEGDVVKWDDRSGGQYWRIADVRWERHQWSFYDHVSKHLFRIGNFAYADSTEEDLEIIGNVHETPELLP